MKSKIHEYQKPKKITMKKTIIVVAIIFSLFSCSKDDEATPVTYQEENPIPTFLANSGFNFSRATTSLGSSTYETGFSFIPKVKGKITAIVAKLHVANPNLRVTIWDKATGTAIVTNYMNISSANTEVRTSITEVVLQKDKEYVFSIKNYYFYNYQKQNIADQVYPITAGNISITGSLYGDNSMPNVLISNLFRGDYSFIFQQTE
jgi:hypothetical protein